LRADRSGELCPRRVAYGWSSLEKPPPELGGVGEGVRRSAKTLDIVVASKAILRASSGLDAGEMIFLARGGLTASAAPLAEPGDMLYILLDKRGLERGLALALTLGCTPLLACSLLLLLLLSLLTPCCTSSLARFPLFGWLLELCLCMGIMPAGISCWMSVGLPAGKGGWNFVDNLGLSSPNPSRCGLYGWTVDVGGGV
jgi:hypothetical protein